MVSLAKLVFGLTFVVLALVCVQPLRAQSQPIQYYYDDLGRLVTVVDSAGNVATYVYDALGNIVQINRSTIGSGALAIFSFNPEKGPVGTVVTIRGQGFSATASSDIVKFNGLAAAVTSASTMTLVATVPTGATTGPISVTVGSNTATSSANFVVVALPIITSVWPKSALFNVVIPNAQVQGTNLLGASFSFNGAGPSVSAVSINSTGTSATMTFSAGSTAGTFALVASAPYGNSGTVATAANRFTVVDPSSTADTNNDGCPDVVDAAYGTDPLAPNSCPNGSSPPLTGQGYSFLFSALNTAGAGGVQAGINEIDSLFSVVNVGGADGVQNTTNEANSLFSVLNLAGAGGVQSTTNEVDSLFSVLNLAGASGVQTTANEADGIPFSVKNTAGSASSRRAGKPSQKRVPQSKSKRSDK